MKAETIIYCLFSALKPFRRNKTLEKKIRAAELYLKGLSYRQVAEILEMLDFHLSGKEKRLP